MARLIVKRVLLGAVTLLAVSLIVFLATQALPGDPARAILGREVTPERLDALRKQLNLDRPLSEQYFSWLVGIFTFDFGDSLANRRPVLTVMGPSLLNSAVLMGTAAIIAAPFAIFIGTLSALRKDKLTDHVTSVFTLIFAAMPEFVIGILLVLVFATGLMNVLPAVYVERPGQQVWDDPKQLVLPCLTLILAVSPYIARIMRATMIEVLDSEYVLQSRLKGLPEPLVIRRHAIPNAIGPVAQVIALQLAWLLGGVVLVEYLFRFPGIGFMLVDAVHNQDLPLLQAIVFVIALFYILVNLVADVITLAANPAVRTAVA